MALFDLYSVGISVITSVSISFLLMDNLIGKLIKELRIFLGSLERVSERISALEQRERERERERERQTVQSSKKDDLKKVAQSVTTSQRRKMKPDRDGKVVFDIETEEYFVWYDGEFKKVCYEA